MNDQTDQTDQTSQQQQNPTILKKKEVVEEKPYITFKSDCPFESVLLSNGEYRREFSNNGSKYEITSETERKIVSSTTCLQIVNPGDQIQKFTSDDSLLGVIQEEKKN